MKRLQKPKYFEDSFASTDKMHFWDPDSPILPENIKKKSGFVLSWVCPECPHKFQAPVRNITIGKGCGFCANRQICRCYICYEKSFATTKNSIYLDPKCGDPRDHFKHSDYEGTFNCPCGHQFESKLDFVSRGKWCPYCVSKIVCADHENCEMCFENSFASVEKCWGWSLKNPGVPRDYLKYAHKYFLFDCEKGHEFPAVLYSVTAGHWCPFCKNKTEGKMLDWFKTTSFKVKPRVSFEWLRNPETNRCLQFDFCIMALMIIIELDGKQHFFEVANWGTPYNAIVRDIWKTRQAMKHGFTIIRINQEDVHKNKGDWQQKLLSQIFAREQPTILYLSTDDRYVKHKDMLDKLIHFENMMKEHLKPKWAKYLEDCFIDTKIKYIAARSKRKVLRESAQALQELLE